MFAETTGDFIVKYETKGRVVLIYSRKRSFDGLGAIHATLEAAGVEFTRGRPPGVSFRGRRRMRNTSSIVDEALSRARACIVAPQATKAGVLFGTDFLSDEVDPARQAKIQAALTDALPETSAGSHTRGFIDALSATVEAVGDAK